MGFENRWNEPPVQAAIETALRAVNAAGKCPGILAMTVEDEEKYASWGARYFATVSTGIIAKALKEAAQGGRAQLNY
jgi:4-hydroxy-2-oxoheptanedioate aldolase